jgi:hypothetical protein
MVVFGAFALKWTPIDLRGVAKISTNTWSRRRPNAVASTGTKEAAPLNSWVKITAAAGEYSAIISGGARASDVVAVTDPLGLAVVTGECGRAYQRQMADRWMQMTFGLSLTVSVCPVFKVISVPFPFRRRNAISPKSISNSDSRKARRPTRSAVVV